ncbi:8992_t:CDS:1, partial [Paraglomus occultum]
MAEKGYKVIFFIENDYVHALGYYTPLLDCFGRDKIAEIVIDSTFKTNQEKFELFAVNANVGGFGVPIAYLYLDTYTPTCHNLHSDNLITTRVGALTQFFLMLRREGVLPTFVLIDKDSGEIAAVEEAWSWTAKIQLCLWHTEHAIIHKFKGKRSTRSQYTYMKAHDTYQQFNFIDPQWIPSERDSRELICLDEKQTEVLSIIKRHALYHPLIPVDKDIFQTTETIYDQS